VNWEFSFYKNSYETSKFKTPFCNYIYERTRQLKNITSFNQIVYLNSKMQHTSAAMKLIKHATRENERK
jgi:hypothetical protein